MGRFLSGMTNDSPMPKNNDITTLGNTITSTLATVITKLAVKGGKCRRRRRLVGRVSHLDVQRRRIFIRCVSHSSRTCSRIFNYFGLPGSASRRGTTHDTTVRRTAHFTTLIPVRITHGTYRLVRVVTSMTHLNGRGTVASTYMTVVTTHSTMLNTLLGIHVGLNSLGSGAFISRLGKRTSRLRRLTYVHRGRLLRIIGRRLGR